MSILKWQSILDEGVMIISKQGRQNSNMTREQIEKQDQKNDVELGNEFTIGNTKSQSQKKSGRQANKK
jgi:hypothetical protein